LKAPGKIQTGATQSVASHPKKRALGHIGFVLQEKSDYKAPQISGGMKSEQKHSTACKRLTKQYLLSLRAGQFLVGNVCDHHYRPGFAERVAPKAEREEQWERVKKIRAEGRICDLFANERGFRQLAKRKRDSAKRLGYEH
jgi:hypothetical protein